MAGWCRSPNHAYHRHHHRQVAHPSSAWAILAQVGEGRSDFFPTLTRPNRKRGEHRGGVEGTVGLIRQRVRVLQLSRFSWGRPVWEHLV